MKIKKLANSNIEFLTDSDELIEVMQQTGAQLIVNAEGVKIIQTGYPEFYIKTDDVVSTQLMPAAAVAFTGDTTALVALLSASFFVLTSENVAYDNTGTDLVATTVQDAITELATEWTETTVNISSAQILAMGTTPVELLAAPGVGKYYDIDKIALEYNAGATGYDFALDFPYLWKSTSSIKIAPSFFDITNCVLQTNNINAPIDLINEVEVMAADFLNSAFILSTWNNTDPTLGDGTIKAKIKYKIVTFG